MTGEFACSLRVVLWQKSLQHELDAVEQCPLHLTNGYTKAFTEHAEGRHVFSRTAIYSEKYSKYFAIFLIDYSIHWPIDEFISFGVPHPV